MLEAVVALPDQLFYNTGISTYFWVVTNRKAPRRRGMVQLIDARDSFVKVRKSLGQKRKEISAEQIADITGASPRWPVRWLRRAWLWSDRWQRVRPAGVSWNSRW